jgi:hypothetical protein
MTEDTPFVHLRLCMKTPPPDEQVGGVLTDCSQMS